VDRLPWLILSTPDSAKTNAHRFKNRHEPPIPQGMSVSAASISAATQANIEADRQIAVMKKSRDIQQDTAEALVNLVKHATPPMPEHIGTLVSVVA
jgi:hypothetical protein